MDSSITSIFRFEVFLLLTLFFFFPSFGRPILYDDLLSKQPRYIKADINFSSSPDSGNLDYNGMNRLIGTNEEVIETAVPMYVSSSFFFFFLHLKYLLSRLFFSETDALLGHAEPIADGYKDMYATSWFTQVAVLSGNFK